MRALLRSALISWTIALPVPTILAPETTKE
jgi:hypothetical protein